MLVSLRVLLVVLLCLLRLLRCSHLHMFLLLLLLLLRVKVMTMFVVVMMWIRGRGIKGAVVRGSTCAWAVFGGASSMPKGGFTVRLAWWAPRVAAVLHSSDTCHSQSQALEAWRGREEEM